MPSHPPERATIDAHRYDLDTISLADELGYGEAWMGDDEVEVSAEEAVLAPAGVDHGLRNTGDRPMRLVIVWGTPIDQEDNE